MPKLIAKSLKFRYLKELLTEGPIQARSCTGKSRALFNLRDAGFCIYTRGWFFISENGITVCDQLGILSNKQEKPE